MMFRGLFSAVLYCIVGAAFAYPAENTYSYNSSGPTGCAGSGTLQFGAIAAFCQSHFTCQNAFYTSNPWEGHRVNAQLVPAGTEQNPCEFQDGAGPWDDALYHLTGSVAQGCPNGGTLSGSTCTCPAGDTDTGTACESSSAPVTNAQALSFLLTSFAVGYCAGWLIYAWKRSMEIASS